MAASNLVTAQTWLAEFAASAISPEMARLNARWVEGSEAVEEFLEGTIAATQKQSTYWNKENQIRRDRVYACFEDGGWIAYGNLAGTEPIPYFKPATPRWNEERQRLIKYETPTKTQARPLFPSLTLTALRRCCDGAGFDYDDVLRRLQSQAVAMRRAQCEFEALDIFTRGIDRDVFWPVWKALGGRSGIVEGWKKAIALTEWGFPAVAIRGVTQWHPAKIKALWPELQELVEASGAIWVVFDQDGNLNSRSSVANQARQLGKAIADLGKQPRFLSWDKEQGKGVDDVLVGLPEGDRRNWLESALEAALTQKQQQRQATIARAALLRQEPQLPAQFESAGEYLPQLPPLTTGAIHWVSAGVGSGKTYRMARDWVKPWIAAGGVALILSPLNSLGQQTAQDLGLPHRHDYGTDRDSQAALRADVSAHGGLTCCPNSAERAIALLPKDRPLLLLFDEAVQTFDDMAEGATLGAERWAACWGDVITLMRRAATNGAIGLLQDGIGADTIALAQVLSGATQTIGIRHHKAVKPQQITISRAPSSGWLSDLMGATQDAPQLVVTTSRNFARQLEAIAIALGIDVVRIDSQTNERGRFRSFFETPDRWIKERQPQLLIFTPTAKTGLSIEGGVSAEDAYFKGVWGYFPALDVDTAWQLLNRYRPNVPRQIWAPAFITPGYGEKPNKLAIIQAEEQEASRWAAAAGFEQSSANPEDTAIKQFSAVRRSRRWAQKVDYFAALSERCRAAGHDVTEVTQGDRDRDIEDIWEAVKEQLVQHDSDYHAALEIDPEVNTWEWANKVLRSVESTHEARCKAAKVRMIARFQHEDLDWNSPALWRAAVFCRPNDATGERPAAAGAALWAEAAVYQAMLRNEFDQAQQVLTANLKAAHLLPTAGSKAAIAAKFRPLYEQLLQRGEIHPEGEIEAQIKQEALHYAEAIDRYWRLKIRDSQSVTAIANKIARKLGLATKRSRYVTTATGREWTFSLTASDVWQTLVRGREQALGLGVTNSLTNDQDLTNKFVTAPDQAPHSPRPERGIAGDRGSPTPIDRGGHQPKTA